MRQWLESQAPRLIRGLCSVGLACVCACSQAAAPEVGVFYFPGWKDNAIGAPSDTPWQPIKQYPEREPLLGWYAEGRQDVMDQQLNWMQSAGISFVVFDYYWADRPILAHAVNAYQTSKGRSAVGYSLMWANHDPGRPKTEAEYRGMVADLVRNHLGRPEFLRAKGAPVFFVMVPAMLEAAARRNGGTSAQWLAMLRSEAAKAGMPQLIILAGSGGGRHDTTLRAKEWGYDGFFAYNYHAGVDGRTRGELRGSRSYAELDQNYREHWAWFLNQQDQYYVVPMTSGWDKRPWGGSQDKAHDLSLSTPQEFKQHLQAGRRAIESSPEKTLGLGVVCCWNEFGEGSFIEPTKAQGSVYLDAVRSIFGR